MSRDDNAGGGQRGLRAVATEGLLAAVASNYGLPPTAVAAATDLGGSSNLNLRIRADDGDYVVRVYRSHVSDDRLRAIHDVRRTMAMSGVPCGGQVATTDGLPFLRVDDRLVEVEQYIDHDAEMDTWKRLELGLGLLGRMHAAIDPNQVAAAGRTAMFANYVSAEQTVACVAAGTQRLRDWGGESERTAADLAADLAAAVASAELPSRTRLPIALAHGDFWDNNVLFRSGNLVFVTDFDYMGVRPRIDDLALTLYFTCLQFPDEHTGNLLKHLLRLLEAYDSAATQRLSDLERQALPKAIARQPLWSIGVWVANLDDETVARGHAAETVPELEWARSVMANLHEWQDAFAR